MLSFRLRESCNNIDVYSEYNELLVPFTGSHNSTTFTDYSPDTKTLTPSGNVKIVTDRLDPFGLSTGVALFDGAGDALTCNKQGNFYLGMSSFTYECFVKFATVSGVHYLFSKNESVFNGGFAILQIDNVIMALASSNGISWNVIDVNELDIGTVTTGVWYYIGVSRSSVGWKTMLNTAPGETSSKTTSDDLVNNTGNQLIGIGTGGYGAFAGEMSNLRFTKGVARELIMPNRPFV